MKVYQCSSADKKALRKDRHAVLRCDNHAKINTNAFASESPTCQLANDNGVGPAIAAVAELAFAPILLLLVIVTANTTTNGQHCGIILESSVYQINTRRYIPV